MKTIIAGLKTGTWFICLLCLFFGPGCAPQGSPVFHAPSRTSPRSPVTAVKDTVLLARIQTKIFSDDLVSHGDADITVRHGVVYLEGTTWDLNQARMLANLIRTVDGVIRVENRLQAPRRGTAFVSANEFVTEKIKMGFLKDPDLTTQPIKVVTSDQEVRLSGTAASQVQKQKAGTIAFEQAGVRRVVNQIVVAP